MARQARLPSTRLVEVIVGNVVRRWIHAVTQDPTDVIILSPYVTSSTADAVLEHTASNPAKLYTVFKSNLFATGSSSLATLKRLFVAGHQVFHVENLHAKIVLTKRMATVGSQNLTAGGCRNREVTVLLEDPKDIAALRDGLTPWLKNAKPVTHEQILDVERRLPSLRRALRAFSRLSKDIDTDTAQRDEKLQRERQAEEECRRLETARLEAVRLEAVRLETVLLEAARHIQEQEHQRLEAARWQRMQVMLERTDCSQPIPTRIIKFPYETLARLRGTDRLTKWTMTDGNEVTLDCRKRYLLVVRESGRVWWPAFNKTRLTQFGIGLLREKIHLAGQTILLDFEGLLPEFRDANVELRLRLTRNDPPLVIRAWFDVEGITLLAPVEPVTQLDNPRFQWLLHQLKNQPEALKSIIVDRLLRGFKYNRNRNGYKATRVLGEVKKIFNFRLHKYRQYHFLVVD